MYGAQNKYCFVPCCKSTSVKTPNKTFITVPEESTRKKNWFKAVRRDMPKSKSKFFCCEDHFKFEDDLENYVRYNLIGGKIVLKPGIVPHIFECQTDTNSAGSAADRSLAAKRARKCLVEEVIAEASTLKETPMTSFLVQSFESEATIVYEQPMATEELVNRKMSVRVLKTTQQQFQTMFEFARDNKIVCGKVGTPSDIERVESLWQEVSTVLNSFDDGPKRSAKLWRHVFTEWKTNVKRKMRRLLPSKPGERVTWRSRLTELEMQLLQLLKIDIHHETQDTSVLPSATSNTISCSEQCSDEFTGSSSCETSDNLQSPHDTVKIEIVDEMLPLENWLYLPKAEVEKSPDILTSSSLKETSQQFVHEQDLGIELEQTRTESLRALNSVLTALVEVQKERAVTEKGNLKLKYFEIHKSFEGFDKFYSDL